MRHGMIRLILGGVWIAAAAVSFASAQFLPAGLYVVLGALFLVSGSRLGKRESKEGHE